MLPVKVASKLLYETSVVSLFVHLPTPALLAAALSRSQSCSHACFPTVFEEERGCSQSMQFVFAVSLSFMHARS